MRQLFILFLVFAVAACTNSSAQSRVDHFVNKVDRTMSEINRVEKAYQEFGRAIGIKERRGKPKKNYDYHTGVTSETRNGKITSIYCKNVWVEVFDNYISAYQLTSQGWKGIGFIYRDNFGEHVISKSAICGPRENVVVKIINNRERTMVWFWQNDNLIKGFTIRTHFN